MSDLGPDALTTLRKTVAGDYWDANVLNQNNIKKKGEPLYSAETIQQRVEQAKEEIHKEIRDFQEQYRDVPYPVKDIIDEKLDKIVKLESDNL